VGDGEEEREGEQDGEEAFKGRHGREVEHVPVKTPREDDEERGREALLMVVVLEYR
jgi:hypothetical protein